MIHRMNAPGRPIAYRPGYCDLAYNCRLLGATNEGLGSFFGVSSRSIDNWTAGHPEFATVVREATAVADARAARCLYQRAGRRFGGMDRSPRCGRRTGAQGRFLRDRNGNHR